MLSERRRLISLSLLLATLLGTAPSKAQPDERVAAAPKESQPPKLDVIARYAIESKTSAVVDLRWSAVDRLYLLHLEDGVEEVEVGAGLPRSRDILPGRHQIGRLLPHRNLAVSGDLVATAAMNGQLLSVRVPPSGAPAEFHIQTTHSSISDFDLEGDRVVLLGWSVRGMEVGHSFLWGAKLEPTLEQLEPLKGLAPAADVRQAQTWSAYMGTEVGSIRILPDGERLVFAGYEPTVRLFSPSGKETSTWSLAALGVSSIVDDVLFIKKTPALIVRRNTGSGSRWLLVLLEPDGLRQYRIPTRGTPAPDARLRADADSRGRIAFVLGQRGRPGKPTDKRQEILVATVP